jgi:glutamine amidotransferase
MAVLCGGISEADDMCRMMGVVAQKPVQVTDYLPSLEHQARQGRHAPHPDGYGVVTAQTGALAVYKETVPIWERAEHFTAQTGSVILMHARKASRGSCALENVHPFYADSPPLALVHNGTILDYQNLESVYGQPIRATVSDTQIYFDLLARHYAQAGDVAASLVNAIETIARQCEFTALNALVTDGVNLAIARYGTTQEEYYTLFTACATGAVLVSTECFAAAPDGGAWQLLANRAVYVVKPPAFTAALTASF